MFHWCMLVLPAIQNEVSISSTMNATAGQPYILVCTVLSKSASNLSWIDPNGVACPQDDHTWQSPTVAGMRDGVHLNWYSTPSEHLRAVYTNASLILSSLHPRARIPFWFRSNVNIVKIASSGLLYHFFFYSSWTDSDDTESSRTPCAAVYHWLSGPDMCNRTYSRGGFLRDN